MSSKSAKQSKKEPKTDSADEAPNEVTWRPWPNCWNNTAKPYRRRLKQPSPLWRRRLIASRPCCRITRIKIVSLESSANVLDEWVGALEAACATLTESNSKLQDKVVDLDRAAVATIFESWAYQNRSKDPPLSFLRTSTCRHFGRGHFTLSAGD